MSFLKSEFVLQLLGLIAGINKHFAGSTLLVGGKSVAAGDVTSGLQACVDACHAVEAAEVAHTAAVAKADAAVAEARPLAGDVKAMVLAAYGRDTAVLADFSLEPRKVATVSPEVRVAAAKKASATRKALGTKGSRQKKAAKAALAAGTPPVTDPSSPPAAEPTTPAAPPPASPVTKS